MMKSLIATLLIPLFLLSGCEQESIASRSFSLPTGDPDNGRLLFMEHRCIECHILAGTDFAGDEDRLTEGSGIAVRLGGTTTKILTHANLVTSIINPSHRIAKGYPLQQISDDGVSKMTYYNEVLTVSELIDLVAFLSSKYEFKSYPETIYPYYVYP